LKKLPKSTEPFMNKISREFRPLPFHAALSGAILLAAKGGMLLVASFVSDKDTLEAYHRFDTGFLELVLCALAFRALYRFLLATRRDARALAPAPTRLNLRAITGGCVALGLLLYSLGALASFQVAELAEHLPHISRQPSLVGAAVLLAGIAEVADRQVSSLRAGRKS
jgi:hypothetical protein